MQYQDGTVNVTNGSTTVVLSGGAAIGNISGGDWFILLDETVTGHGVQYTVATNATSDTQFSLTAPWAGATAVAKVYAIQRDFDVNGIAIFSGGEAAAAVLMNRNNQILLSLSGGGSTGGNFQTILGGFTFAGQGNQVAAVNAEETSLEAIDHRFVLDAVAELTPTSLAGRVVHYSALSGTANVDADGRVTQWNDISGNSRHATDDPIGPLLVGEAGRAGRGLNFETSAAAGDDTMMIATVPSPTNEIFIFAIGRVDQRHAGSNNLWKTAHVSSVDTQVAGDIELAPAASGPTLNLRISTSAGIGQLVPLGPFKNGLPFIIGVKLVSGALDGWAVGQGQTPQRIATTYNHGSGFNADRVRLGLSPDVVTAHVMHEFVITSTMPGMDSIQRLVIWGMNRYFLSQVGVDEVDPRFAAPVNLQGNLLIYPRRPVVETDGDTVIKGIFGPARPIAVPNVATASLDWGGSLFRNTGDIAFQLTLRNSAPIGWELEIEQDAESSGSVSILFESGASNLDGFNQSVSVAKRLLVRCVRNTNGVSAEYVGYQDAPLGTLVLAVLPDDVNYDLIDASGANVSIVYEAPLTANRVVTIDTAALPDAGTAREIRVTHVASGGFEVEVTDGSMSTTLVVGQTALLTATSGGATLTYHGPIEATGTAGVAQLDPNIIADLPVISTMASTSKFWVGAATDDFNSKAITYADLLAQLDAAIGTAVGGENFDHVSYAGNYSSTAFQIGTDGADQNEWSKFTTTAAHKIHFPAGLPANAYGIVQVPEGSGSTFTSAATISVNGVVDRGGAGAVLPFPGKLCSWVRADDGTITVLGDTGETTTAYATMNQNDQILRRPVLEDVAETSPSPSATTTLTLNYESGNVFNVTLTASISTVTFQNWPASGLCGSITLRTTQGAGPFSITWPAAVDWGAAGQPTLSSASGAFDIFCFMTWNGGTKIFGMTGWQDA